MGATFIVVGDDLQVEMTWQKEKEKVERVIGNAAAYLFDKGQGDHGDEDNPITFDDLSNQEKLDIVYNHLGQVAINAADTWTSTEAQRVARDATVPHEL